MRRPNAAIIVQFERCVNLTKAARETRQEYSIAADYVPRPHTKVTSQVDYLFFTAFCL